MDNYSSVSGENGGNGKIGGFIRAYGIILFVYTSVVLFNTESYNLKGQANYCTVKDSATQDELYLCAA